MKSGLFFVSVLVVTALVCSSFMTTPQNDPWVVPEKFKRMENPIEADKESINIGKVLYAKHCKSCHGKEGLGDGPKAAQLETPSGDFTDEKFQSQSDGAIFYKTKEGRGDMPTFSKKIPYDEDIWHLVNYLRTLD